MEYLLVDGIEEPEPEMKALEQETCHLFLLAVLVSLYCNPLASNNQG